MNSPTITELFDYTYWAFDLIWPAIDQLDDARFTQDLGYSHGSIRNQVVHLISSHRRWLNRLQGVELAPRLEFADFPDKSSTRKEWDIARDEMLAYVKTLSQADLDEMVPFQFPARAIDSAQPRRTILLHLVNHATDHRAQILALLNREFNIETPEQDFILYLCDQGN